MSTTIQVPRERLLIILQKWLIRADKGVELAEEHFKMTTSDASTVPIGYRHLSAMDGVSKATRWRDHLRALKFASENHWLVTLGEDDFYLLEP